MEFIYKWRKQLKGRGYFAMITLIIEESNITTIEEVYSGKGFYRQGYIESVLKIGYDEWKQGAKDGLLYALSLTNKKYEIKIMAIEGLTSDTSREVVAYTSFLAFCEFNKIKVSDDIKNKFEAQISKSFEHYD